MLKVFECFSGVGSQRMALRNIGIDFEVIGISEVDRFALLGYSAIHHENEYCGIPSKEEMLAVFNKYNIGYNFSTNKSEIPKDIEGITKLYKAHVLSKNFGDIRLIKPETLPDMDLFTYSFPCKNISVAGRQDSFEKGSETQSSLLWECEKIIENKRPKYLMMENVKNILSEKHIGLLEEWIKILDSLGYNSYYKLLNAKDYGVPQKRERVIMISILKEHDNSNFKFPKMTKSNKSLKTLLSETVDTKYYIDNKTRNYMIDFNNKYSVRKNIKDIENGLSEECVDIKKLIRTIPNIELKRIDVPVAEINCINPRKFDGRQTYQQDRIYDARGIVPAICASLACLKIVDPVSSDLQSLEIRKLTPLECWRLMGFKDEDYYKAERIGLNDNKLYERAGRGIVIPMLEEIFKNLFNKNV